MVGWKLVGEKLHDIYTNACNKNDIVCNIHDVCGRQWHIMLARVRRVVAL